MIGADRIKSRTATQIMLAGKHKRLNMRAGANIIVVIMEGVRSEPYTLTIERKAADDDDEE